MFTNPLTGLSFKRLRSERDIEPEEESNSCSVDENGNGATNIIQEYINNVDLRSDFVENDLLNCLNEIFEPDTSFSRILVQHLTGLKGKHWEIFLEEKSKGWIALSPSGSGLKTIILVLIYTLLIPRSENKKIDNYIFGFEELENNLHPALQRRLFLYLEKFALTNNTHLFITTHSNVVIDLFSNDKHAQLFNVANDGKKRVSIQ